MGKGNSKSDGPPPLLSKPWREINFENKRNTLQSVRDYQPLIEGQQIRILLYGPVGAGKSSFINSVQSVLRGRMYTQALVDNTSHDCFTKKFTTYKIQKDNPQSFYPFVFNDIMGLQHLKGVLADDIKLALKGHVKEGYSFNPESKLSEDSQFYRKCPSNNDKVHVLVCVIDANTVSTMTGPTLQKIQDIRKEASELGIPQVVIFTKIDETCPEIKDDLKNVYKLQIVKEKIEQFSVNVGIPLNCIFPVKNYNSEIHLDNVVDTLILSTLINIINFGEDYVNFSKCLSEIKQE